MEFLRTQKAILSFADNRITIGGQPFRELPLVQHKTYLLRARTKTLVNVNCEFQEGSSYVPHIQAGPGIFAGECIVKAHDHRASLFIVNATSYDINLTLPPIKKHEFEASARVRLTRSATQSPHDSDAERIEAILNELDFNSLNSEERSHVQYLVTKFPHQFHLSSDRLSMTKAATHKIITTDDIPINVKQYRHPPYLRDEVQKQIAELIDNDIVEESDSPYNSPLWIVPKKAGPNEKLRDYDYEIVHKPGRVNANADALSRNPVPISPPDPTSPCADDYEHEIERRVFSINCLPEVREQESHRGLAKDGQEVDRQGELARPGGSPQGTAGTRGSLREEPNPGDYHRAVSSYGQKFHLGNLTSPNELTCHHVSSLHADGHESHLEEFLHLERRVSHLSTPPDEPSHRKRNADEMEVLTDYDEREDKLIEGISLLPNGQVIRQHFVERRSVRMAVAKKRREKPPELTPPPGKLSYSRDPLLMHRDNYAHFFSVDCDTRKPLEQQLLDLNYLDLELIKTQQLNVGAITESGLPSGYSLFSLFIRNNHEETPDIDVVSEVLTNLGTALIELGKNSISIAKSYEHLDDMYWLPIETHLEELAISLHLDITICTGEVTTPNEEDRPNIIREAHDSAVAGHKGVIKTYHRIRERYYWPNMMEEIRRRPYTTFNDPIILFTRRPLYAI
uniref:RNA-directed DNA polymerase n=1 Tax=Trichogramma kaykai TaxID=54128 RepID=A0ABD2WHT6_9HYME